MKQIFYAKPNMKTMVKEKFKLIIILFENGSILYHKKRTERFIEKQSKMLSMLVTLESTILRK